VISILCPSRGRPRAFASMVHSAYANAHDPDQVEIVCYLDEDDPQRDGYTGANDLQRVRFLTGRRIVLSDMWNQCSQAAGGDILMHCGDDIRFRTPDWDTLVTDAHARYPDGIAVVHGEDGTFHDGHGTHCFLTRRWVETVGYFTPPWFVSDFADTWLNELADTIGRRIFLPDLFTEHLHPEYGLSPRDETLTDRYERHHAERPDLLYAELAPRRVEDAEKLRAAMLP
jgi:hypothetical protein